MLVIPGVLVAVGQQENCEDKKRDEPVRLYAAENFMASGIANDMGNISDEAGRTKSVSSFKSTDETALLSTCVTIKFDTLVNTNPDSITVDFGATNCMGNDGRNRRGKLQIIYTGKYKDSLNTITITPINYFVNDNKVSGSKVIKNLGHNSQGHLLYSLKEDLVIQKADGSGNITFSAQRYREWMSGESTVVWIDDVYSITGSASGTNANGRSFTSNITKALIRKMDIGCRKYFVSGIIEHTPAQKATRKLDFGDGTCDNKAVLTINGKEYQIDLQ